MRLSKKMQIGYGIIFALLGLVVVGSMVNVISLSETINTITSEQYRKIQAAHGMSRALDRQDNGLLQILLQDTQKGIGSFRKNEADFLKWLARAKDSIRSPKEKEIVNEIETNYTTLREQFSALTDFPAERRSDADSMRDAYQKTIGPLFSQIGQNCLLLSHLNETDLHRAGVSAEGQATYTVWFVGLVAMLTLIGGYVFSQRISAQILDTIGQLEQATARIISDDLPSEVPVSTQDELGRLVAMFNQMTSKLRHHHEMSANKIEIEKKKSNAILASIEDGLIIFDPQLVVTGINPVAQRMLFLKSSDTVTLRCSDILKRTPICELLYNIIESGEPPNIPDKQRMVAISENEQLHHYLFSINVINGEEEKISGIVLLLRDVTRLKEVERLKNEFILAASHELRTPLTSIGMNIDLLIEEVSARLGDEEKGYLQAAHEEVHRMKALVTDLLDLSKIESGRIALEFESVPIKTLFEYVQKVFKTQLERKSVSLTGALTENLPNIRADANKITWVLSNLISNALRYVNQGGHIHFVANRIGPQIHLSVRDDGPGIPLNYQSKIFQKYVQVKGQESGGTGLGLAICKEIVRAHGGGIWVESLPNKGSTFTFTLPVAH